MIGQLCGKYRLVESIGRGTVSEVFRAEHDITGEAAAVKVFAQRIAAEKDVLKTVFEQARAATRLGHPSICRVLDYGATEDGAAYIAMQLLDGESLHQRMVRAGEIGIGMSKGLGFAGNLADALDAAHTADILHGDIKPSNVFIVADPDSPLGERVILLDFGVSMLVGRGSTGEAELGTAGFMAPERCRQAEVGPPADIYALGCLLFRMITGRSAIDGSRAGGFTLAHINHTPVPITELADDAPVTLAELIAAMLEKDPVDRPSATDVGAKLVRVGDLVKARVTADAAVAQLGEAETAIAPAEPLYGEDEATVLDSGILAGFTTDRDASTVPAEDVRDPDADDGGSIDDAADEDIEVDLPAPAPKDRKKKKAAPLEEPPTYNELGANTMDLEDLPAPLAKSGEDDEDDDEAPGLPAPVPKRRDADLPAPLPSVRAGKTPPPEPLGDPPTMEDVGDRGDPLEEVLGLPAPITFRTPTGAEDAAPSGELALVKDEDKGKIPERPGGAGELALIGAGDDKPGRGELGAPLPAASRQAATSKPPPTPSDKSKSDQSDKDNKGGAGKVKRKPKPRKPAAPSNPALLSMLDEQVHGDDAPTMIVPAAIDAMAIAKEEAEKSKVEALPPPPRRQVSAFGGTALPDLGDDEDLPWWRTLPPEWVRWGSIGAGVLAVLIIFLLARSCDDGASAPASAPEADDVADAGTD